MAAITSAAIGVASTAYSFAQAAKQSKMSKQAEADAAKAMAEARKKLEINYYDALSLPTKVYEAERQDIQKEANAALQQASEAGGRELVATAGRVQQAVQESERAISENEAERLLQLQKMSAEEDSRLRDVGVQLDMGEVTGSQQKAADLQQASAQSLTQGFQSLGGAIGAAGDAISLYGKSAGGKAVDAARIAYEKKASSGDLDPRFMRENSTTKIKEPLPFLDALAIQNPQFAGVSTYGGDQYAKWASGLNRGDIKNISGYDWSAVTK